MSETGGEHVVFPWAVASFADAEEHRSELVAGHFGGWSASARPAIQPEGAAAPARRTHRAAVSVSSDSE
eukprot:9726543-Alexandrium_andersonii.AAC.1